MRNDDFPHPRAMTTRIAGRGFKSHAMNHASAGTGRARSAVSEPGAIRAGSGSNPNR